MATTYQLTTHDMVKRITDDGRVAWIPRDPKNADYGLYLAAGGDAIALPAAPDRVPVVEPDPLPALLAAIDNVSNLAQAKRLLKAIARRVALRHLANDPDGALP